MKTKDPILRVFDEKKKEIMNFQIMMFLFSQPFIYCIIFIKFVKFYDINSTGEIQNCMFYFELNLNSSQNQGNAFKRKHTGTCILPTFDKNQS